MAEGSASLDAILADAGGGATRRWFPGVAGAKLVAKLATRPWKVARRGAGYGGERITNKKKREAGLKKNGKPT